MYENCFIHWVSEFFFFFFFLKIELVLSSVFVVLMCSTGVATVNFIKFSFSCPANCHPQVEHTQRPVENFHRFDNAVPSIAHWRWDEVCEWMAKLYELEIMTSESCGSTTKRIGWNFILFVEKLTWFKYAPMTATTTTTSERNEIFIFRKLFELE